MTTKETDHTFSLCRVSVAMCTYNGAAYLGLQLDSILRQSQLPDEMVICDDISVDATLAILEAFAVNAPFPVHIHRNEETLRPAQNFAKCIGLCSGDVIVLTDQDDLWSVDRIAATRAAFVADPALTFVFSDAPLVDQEGQYLGRSIYSGLPLPAKDRKLVMEGRSLQDVILRFGVIWGTTMAFRASLRSMVLPIPLRWSHDEWISLVLSSLGHSKRMKQPVTCHRQHPGQMFGTVEWTMGMHLRLAKEHGPSFYESEMERLNFGIGAAAAKPELRSSLVPRLEEKRLFLKRRISIQAGPLGGVLPMAGLLATRGYTRHAAGLRSWAKDLLMLLHII